MKKQNLLPLLLILAVACGPKWEAHDGDGYLHNTQKGGPTLGYTSAVILYDDLIVVLLIPCTDTHRTGTGTGLTDTV